jgi:CheY-like chemotaxis protein
MLRRLIGEHIQVVTVFGERLGRVKADPGQLDQVILNLAVNARDAMPSGGKLIIETANVELDESYTRSRPDARPGQHVMLAVSDTGIGMDSTTLAHIFEPFFTTKAEGKGTGLGLATVYGIVKQSGGHVLVYSEPGRGSTFKVYLPRVPEEVDAEGDESGEPEPALGGHETVMLVEDEESLRMMIQEILGESGYDVLDCATPEAAIEKARTHRGSIELLLTDVVLPRMSGRETAASLLAMRPGLRVVYMSGYTDQVVGQQGVIEPNTHFLQKPFTAEALLRKLRLVLDEPPPAPPTSGEPIARRHH